jgi:hypothetical protein
VEKNYVGDHDIDGSILMYIVKEQRFMTWIHFMWLRKGTSANTVLKFQVACNSSLWCG